MDKKEQRAGQGEPEKINRNDPRAESAEPADRHLVEDGDGRVWPPAEGQDPVKEDKP
jgi:hypothetical protein